MESLPECVEMILRNALRVRESFSRWKQSLYWATILGSERRLVSARRFTAVLRRKFSTASTHGGTAKTHALKRRRFFKTNNSIAFSPEFQWPRPAEPNESHFITARATPRVPI